MFVKTALSQTRALHGLKAMGFSDERLAELAGVPMADVTARRTSFRFARSTSA